MQELLVRVQRCGKLHALSATARPASTPSAFARKEATARVEYGILEVKD